MSDTLPRSDRLERFVAEPTKSLWTLAFPMMLGMSVQTFYVLADMVFVGRFSPDALAALAFNMPVVFFSVGMVVGLGTGVTAVIAQYIGAGDKRGADSSAEHAVALGVVMAVVMTAGGLLWGPSFLSILGVPAPILEPAWEYLQVIAGGFTFIVMASFFRSILAGEGDMKTPVFVLAMGLLLNIALDPLMIFGLGMGVRGAAMASVVSQATVTAVFVVLLFFKKHTYLSFDLKSFEPSALILGKIFKIGLPASFAFLIVSFGSGVFNRILSSFSSAAVAGYQVGTRLDHVFLMPVMAMSTALVTLVGMFYGAERTDLMRQVILYAMSRAMMIALLVGTVFFIWAPQLVAVFTDDPEIRLAGAQYLRTIVFAYPCIVASMLAGRSLQGMGYGAPMMVLTTLRVLLIAAPLAYVLVYWMHKPLEWVWGAMVSGMVGSAVIGLAWLRHALHKRTRPQDEANHQPELTEDLLTYS